MARLQRAALALLALAAAGAAAPSAGQGGCRQDIPPPSEGWLNPSGCIKCSPDNATCLECGSHHVLAANGTCTRCRPPGDFWMFCAKCAADAPDVCTGCVDIQYSSDVFEIFGVFLAENGTCAPCAWATPGCYSCHDLNGTCTQCNHFSALLGSECVPCTDMNCLRCEGSPDRCIECTPPGWMLTSSPGVHLDEANHSCIPCADPACTYCPGGQCETCAEGHVLKDGACVPCPQPHCAECRAGAEKCFNCSPQWVLDPGTRDCLPCGVANCTQCASPGKCAWCASGFRVTQEGGCEQCRVAHCENCYEDAGRCVAPYGCLPGFRLDNATNSCQQCTVPRCLGCLVSTDLCSGCEAGFKPGEPVAGTSPPSSTECVPDAKAQLEQAMLGAR